MRKSVIAHLTHAIPLSSQNPTHMTKALIEIYEIKVSCDQALKSVQYKQKKPELWREIRMKSGNIGASTNAPTQ